MQEKKSKLKAFAAALTGAAEEKAAAMNAETGSWSARRSRNMQRPWPPRPEKRRASALADAKVKENKRIVAEGLAAKRSLLQFREDCADDVFAEVRRKILELPQRPEVRRNAQKPALARPRRRPRRERPRSGSGARTWATPRASTRPRPAWLEFLEGGFSLGGLVLECPERCRHIDLSFDSALRGPGGQVLRAHRLSLEEADGE